MVAPDLVEFQLEWVNRCWPVLSEVIGHRYREKDLVADIEAGDAILFPGSNAAVVARVVNHPSGRKVCHALAAGDTLQLMHLISTAEQFSENQRCDGIALEVRRGLENGLEGYSETGVVLSRPLP